MWFYPFGALFNLVTALLVGSFVLCKNWKAKANRGFFLFGFSVAFWSFGYFFWQLSKTAEEAVFWCRVLSLGSTWITIWYYYFVIHLLELKPRKYRTIFIVGATMASIFSLSDFTTGLMISSVKPFMIFKFWPVPGFFYHIYLVMFLFYAYYATFLLFVEFRNGGEFRKRQIRYVFLGTFIGYLGGCTNYPAWYGIPLLPIGNILVSIYPILVGYSIIKYRLFEIDTVIHRTILWLLTSSLILLPVGVMLFFTRGWMATLNWLPLTFLMTGLFYVFLFYYRKMQPEIDQIFRRRKYDYYAVLAGLGQKVGSELDIQRVIDRLFKELKEILYIRNGLLLVQLPGTRDYSEAGSCGYESAASPAKKESSRGLEHKSLLAQWLNDQQRALEREQVQFDPQYALIKDHALDFFKRNSLEVLIPVTMEGKVNALLGIGKKDNLQAYTAKDIELLENMGRQIGITIDNAMHHEDIVEKERLAEEMKLGREIQMALLPQDAPQIPGLLIHGLMQPAKEIGGDYYDFITL
ncbi:MAG: histidine kinase N-terminal 7TM domain-containing protein, partial [Candidatus Omnitrophota bacterium]